MDLRRPHDDHGWSQAHDAGRLYVQKMLGSKVQTTFKENIAGRAAAAADRREPRTAGLQDDLRNVVRLLRQEARGEVSERPLRAGDGHGYGQEPGEYFGAAEDTVFLSGMAAGAATKNGTLGLVVAFRSPR